MDGHNERPTHLAKERTSFALINALGYGMICLVAIRTGSFYLRVLTESIAAGYLLNLTLWGWFSCGSPLIRLLLTLVGYSTVFVGCYFVLDGLFASWFENAIWYAPAISVLALSLKIFGYQIERKEISKRPSTFSIRALMILTALVAASFPLLGAYTKSRGNGQLPSQWLWDALVLVVPITVICVGLFFSVLRKKPVPTILVLILAPIAGTLICRLYQWDFYQTIVIQSTTLALMTAMFAMATRFRGYRLDRSAGDSPYKRAIFGR